MVRPGAGSPRPARPVTPRTGSCRRRRLGPIRATAPTAPNVLTERASSAATSPPASARHDHGRGRAATVTLTIIDVRRRHEPLPARPVPLALRPGRPVLHVLGRRRQRELPARASRRPTPSARALSPPSSRPATPAAGRTSTSRSSRWPRPPAARPRSRRPSWRCPRRPATPSSPPQATSQRAEPARSASTRQRLQRRLRPAARHCHGRPDQGLHNSTSPARSELGLFCFRGVASVAGKMRR